MHYAALVLFFVPALMAQSTRPLLEHTFEDGEEGWQGMGGNVQVKTVAGGAVSTSKSALALNYRVEPKQMGMAVFAVSSSLAAMKTLRFYLKTDHATPIAVILSETKPGGDYTAVVWSPKDTWQEVELAPSDFALNDGPNDSKDEDGKLDLDKIQGIAILDLSFFTATLNSAVPIKMDKVTGDHTLWIDDFRILAEEAKPAAAAATPIDNFDRKNLQWLVLGRASLAVANESPLKGKTVEATYEQASDGFVMFMRRLNHVNLSNSSGIAFEIASDKPAHMILSLESKVPNIVKPVRFNFTLDVPGGRQPVARRLAYKDFELAEDAPQNSPSRIDPAFLRSFSVVDLQGMVGGASGSNTMWIAGLSAYK